MDSSPTDRRPPHIFPSTRVQTSMYCVQTKVGVDKHKTFVSDKQFWLTQPIWRLGENTTVDTKPAAIATSSAPSFRLSVASAYEHQSESHSKFFFGQKCDAGGEVTRVKANFNTYKQMPRAFKRVYVTPAAARLLRSWVRIPPGPWIFVCRECRVLSGRGLCDELITRPEDSYRLW